MGKIAFVFSGQGAQYGGMGRSLAEASAAARRVFEMADAVRPGTSAQCFEAPVEELSVTKNTQPCLFCVDLAAAEALREAGIVPDYVAGFSLGEVAAVTFAGMFAPEEGFLLVVRRGAAMQEAAEAVESGMAAVMKLDNAAVEALCASHPGVYPVNYNCPGQLVVAGEKGALPAFLADAAAAGGRAVPLNVSGGFHSPFMESAAEKLAKALEPLAAKETEMPVFANFNAAPYAKGTEKELLTKQVKSPVRWQETVENLIAAGVDTFVEVGAGKTLCGLIRRTDRSVRVMNVEDAETLAAAVSALQK